MQKKILSVLFILLSACSTTPNPLEHDIGEYYTDVPQIDHSASLVTSTLLDPIANKV